MMGSTSGSKYLDNVFDAKTGYGSVPNSESIDYFGFTIYMRPSEFLSLATENARLKPEFYENLLKEHEPIGYPFLSVKDEDNGYWKVEGHEGRHRARAIQNVFGDNVFIPVHVFPQGMRNRNLNPKLLAMPFLPERMDIGKKTLKEAYNQLKFFKPEMVDVKSKHLNVGKIEKHTNYKHPSLLASAPSRQSDLMRTQSPTVLIRTLRNDDDVTEVVEDQPQKMHIQKNFVPSPCGSKSLQRGNS